MGNSLLITFELSERGGGTHLRMTETGFREMGWEVAVLEAQYQDHAAGWTSSCLSWSSTPQRSRWLDDLRVDDALWSAVGDPTRRQMLDLLLIDGQGTATTLSERLPVTRQAVSKHLAVLDRAGLVHGAAAGRERRYWVDDAQLARAATQLAAVGSTWDGRLRRIARIAERIEREKQTPKQQNHEQANEENDMTDIHHRIGVESSSVDDVYAALTTIDGLSSWWTRDTTGDPAPAGRSSSASRRAASTWR